jgi:hypothetical protein
MYSWKRACSATRPVAQKRKEKRKERKERNERKEKKNRVTLGKVEALLEEEEEEEGGAGGWLYLQLETRERVQWKPAAQRNVTQRNEGTKKCRDRERLVKHAPRNSEEPSIVAIDSSRCSSARITCRIEHNSFTTYVHDAVYAPHMMYVTVYHTHHYILS